MCAGGIHFENAAKEGHARIELIKFQYFAALDLPRIHKGCGTVYTRSTNAAVHDITPVHLPVLHLVAVFSNSL
jgi:hypothetical protein